MIVKCNECETDLISVEDTDSAGTIGAKINRAGYVYKNPILFTGKNTPLYFCSKECNKIYYKKHVPENKEVSDTLSDLKKQIPVMAKNTAEAVGKFMSGLQKLQRK